MEIIYFTLAAIVLYVAADKILERIEISIGRRLKQRSLLFFAILLALSLVSFTLIQKLSGA